MESIWKHVFAVIWIFVLISDARPPSSSVEITKYTGEKQEFLDNLVRDRSQNSREAHDSSLQDQNEEKRSIKKTYTKEEIDRKKVDADSNLEILLESMSDNGHNAIGIHPDQKDTVKGMKLEEKHEESTITEKNQSNHIAHKRKRNFLPPIYTYEFDIYWPNATIPYYINLDAFENKGKVEKTIQEAKDDFETKTCVRLIHKTKEELESEEVEFYVNITNKQDGCYSEVGTLEEARNKGQILNLQEDGCMDKSTVIHEFCHALGMAHEQSRQDRDKHVKVFYDNVLEDQKYNLDKEETLDKNPYDYSSVMQYELKAYTKKNWQNVMEFRDPNLEFLAGEATELSFYDVMDITKAYECAEDCKTDVVCKNTAFIDHKCKCYCPEGLKGEDCNTIASDDCGGIIDLVPGKEIEITSPNYPNNYDVDKTCYWLLRAQNTTTQRVMIEVLDFDLPSNRELFRCYHWLEVRYNLIAQPGRKFCDDRIYENKITTTEFGNPELMMLIFDTATVTGVEATKGFRLKAQAIEISPEGCVTEPPTVGNATNDFNEVGSTVGAIIRYKCDYYHQMVGHNTITCEADGTWTDVQFYCKEMDPIFECFFDDGSCGVTLSSEDGNYEWYIKTDTWSEPDENGNQIEQTNSYFTVSPKTANKATFARFTLPNYLKADKTYCLSFYFDRTSTSDSCAILYVGDEYYNRWEYPDCKKGGWDLFQGNYGPFDDINVSKTKMLITAEIENEEGGEFNIDIDNLILSEGPC